MMSTAHRMLMPGGPHGSCLMPTHCSAVLYTLEKHSLQRVCALDVEFDPAVEEVASNGHQADGEPFTPIVVQSLLQLLRVWGVAVGDSFRGSPDKHQAQTAANKVANPEQ